MFLWKNANLRPHWHQVTALFVHHYTKSHLRQLGRTASMKTTRTPWVASLIGFKWLQVLTIFWHVLTCFDQSKCWGSMSLCPWSVRCRCIWMSSRPCSKPLRPADVQLHVRSGRGQWLASDLQQVSPIDSFGYPPVLGQTQISGVSRMWEVTAKSRPQFCRLAAPYKPYLITIRLSQNVSLVSVKRFGFFHLKQ